MDNLLLRQFRFRQPVAGLEPVRLLAPPAAAEKSRPLSPRTRLASRLRPPDSLPAKD